jgi:hypothetical protein
MGCHAQAPAWDHVPCAPTFPTGDSQDDLVAVNQAAGQKKGDPAAQSGYWAAVQAAAADANNIHSAAVGSKPSPAAPRVSSHQAGPNDSPHTGSHKSDLQRTKDRLQAMYTGGLVLPVPFLRAAGAHPLALLGSQAARRSQAPAEVDLGLLPTSPGASWEALLNTLQPQHCF